MNDLMRDVTGVAMAIVGVAILYTLVNPNNVTAQVISSAAGGFSQMLGTAMGGGMGTTNRTGRVTLTGYN